MTRVVTRDDARKLVDVDESDAKAAAAMLERLDAWVAANHPPGYSWTFDPRGRAVFALVDAGRLVALENEAGKRVDSAAIRESER